MGLSLEKKQELVRLSLEKRNVPTDVKLAVKMVSDVSGSMRSLYNNGVMQELVDRLIPVAMRFDDNGELESFAFGDRAVEMDAPITDADFGNYIGKKFLVNVPNGVLWSGTKYSEALKAIEESVNPKRTFMQMFAKKSNAQPSYILFQTDGETNGDEEQTERILERLGKLKCYVQFIGVGNAHFGFLREMADQFDHVGFVTFPDLANTSDQAMYEALLSEEVCSWIKSV